jgi:membrane protease YdiL (CAAX protease family)
MRPVRVVSVYFLVVFMGGALLAPWIYHLVHVTSSLVPSLQGLASKPFPRYVNRCFLILGLAGLLPVLRAVDLQSWRAIGLPHRPKAFPQIAWGFLLGLGSLACVVMLALASGARHWAPAHNAWSVASYLAKSGLTALLVAPLEEIFFRGALFGALRKTFHWTMALVLSSAVYALLHFLERPESPGQVAWSSGLAVLLGMLGGFADAGKFIPAFFNLTLVGMILGLGYQRLGSLHFSIGLHAGWIFWLKSYSFLTEGSAGNAVWLFGTGRLIDGWLVCGILALILAGLNWALHPDPVHTGWKERQMLS